MNTEPKAVNGINLEMLPGLAAAMKGEKIASLPVNERQEHPAAKWLYRRSKAGSFTLSKLDAYYLGNELDALYARVRELEKAGGTLVRQVLAAKESITQRPGMIYAGDGHTEPYEYTDAPEPNDPDGDEAR
jgi:hypothetical protein